MDFIVSEKTVLANTMFAINFVCASNLQKFQQQASIRDTCYVLHSPYIKMEQLKTDVF